LKRGVDYAAQLQGSAGSRHHDGKRKRGSRIINVERRHGAEITIGYCWRIVSLSSQAGKA